MLTLYGIKNCDTVKKARKWFDAADIAYTFVDVRTDGITAADIQHWLSAVGAGVLVNKRSTTWKNLDDAARQTNPADLLLAHPTLIKRPVVTRGDTVMVGFSAERYHAAFLAG